MFVCFLPYCDSCWEIFGKKFRWKIFPKNSKVLNQIRIFWIWAVWDLPFRLSYCLFVSLMPGVKHSSLSLKKIYYSKCWSLVMNRGQRIWWFLKNNVCTLLRITRKRIDKHPKDGRDHITQSTNIYVHEGHHRSM